MPVELPRSASGAAPSVEVPIDTIFLIAGATGGVGKRVTARLLAAGKHVRALVRDLDKGKAMLVRARDRAHRPPGTGPGTGRTGRAGTTSQLCRARAQAQLHQLGSLGAAGGAGQGRAGEGAALSSSAVHPAAVGGLHGP